MSSSSSSGGLGFAGSQALGMLVGLVVGIVVIVLVVGCGSTGPAGANAAPEPASPWTALPQTPDKRVGIWTMCSNGVRLFMVVSGPATGPAITTAPDRVCEGR